MSHFRSLSHKPYLGLLLNSKTSLSGFVLEDEDKKREREFETEILSVVILMMF
jgi:hypothetical protein